MSTGHGLAMPIGEGVCPVCLLRPDTMFLNGQEQQLDALRRVTFLPVCSPTEYGLLDSQIRRE